MVKSDTNEMFASVVEWDGCEYPVFMVGDGTPEGIVFWLELNPCVAAELIEMVMRAALMPSCGECEPCECDHCDETELLAMDKRND